MAARGNRLLHGTLDALVLKAVSRGPLHGYAIARWLERETSDAISVEEGSLYPALYRLEKDGLLTSEWGLSELDRRAKFYRLTDEGRARLEADTEAWVAFRRAVSAVLEPGGP